MEFINQGKDIFIFVLFFFTFKELSNSLVHLPKQKSPEHPLYLLITVKLNSGCF